MSSSSEPKELKVLFNQIQSFKKAALRPAFKSPSSASVLSVSEESQEQPVAMNKEDVKKEPDEEEKVVKKAECVCTYKRDMGKLVITDKYIQFRSLHFDERIPFDDILAVKKKGGAKLNIRTKNEAHSFGPFDDIRRGSVYETIKAIIDEKQGAAGAAGGSSGGTSINVNEIVGISDKVVEEVFTDKQRPAYQAPVFREPTDKDTVGLNETFPLALRPLFAVFMSDSSTFSKDLHEKCEDLEIEINPWAADASDAFHTRKLIFKKKSRMVSCTVHQTQRVRLHSPTELYFETTSVMEGVPFSDCFTVDTLWRWKQEGEETRVQSWIHIEWLKSCWIKGKIEKGSITGTEEYLNFWKEVAQAKIKQLSGAAPEEKPSEGAGAGGKAKAKGGGVDVGLILQIGAGLLGLLFFVLWLWYWWSAGSYYATACALTTQLTEVQGVNDQLQLRVLELEAQLQTERNKPPPEPERVAVPEPILLAEGDVARLIRDWQGKLRQASELMANVAGTMDVDPVTEELAHKAAATSVHKTTLTVTPPPTPEEAAKSEE